MRGRACSSIVVDINENEPWGVSIPSNSLPFQYIIIVSPVLFNLMELSLYVQQAVPV